MKLSLLYEFVELSRCLNFSKAAEQLHLTQPVLSRHISELERELGVQLLLRNTRSVQLTEMGRIYAEGSRQTISRYEETIERIKSATNGVIGTLSIGFLHNAVKLFLSSFITHFMELYPQIRLEYFASEMPELISNLDHDIIDIGFTLDIFKANPYFYKTKNIFKDHLCVLLPLNHPLCKKDKLSIKDLSGEPLITYSKESNPWTDAFNQKLFAYHETEYNVCIEAPNFYSALFYVTTNRGLIIIPEHMASTDEENIVKKRLQDDNAIVYVNLICKKDNHNAIINLFFDEFEKFYSQEWLTS